MKTFFSKIKPCFFVVLIGLTKQTAAQDCGVVLRHLDVNPVLINAAENRKARRIVPLQDIERPALKLPFFEDFSNLYSPFPNEALWEDNMVFINASFPLFPPTIGVATFDALDASGRLYEHAAVYTFGADTLTSRPIRLDSIFDENPREITVADSVFFSFYFQPGGGFGTAWDGNIRGRAPRVGDYLILEFLSDLGDWNIAWTSDSAKYWQLPAGVNRGNNRTLERFCWDCANDTVILIRTDVGDTIFRDTIVSTVISGTFRDTTYIRNDTVFNYTVVVLPDFKKEFFRQVAILVPPEYFYNGFQFRFRNLNSLDPPEHQSPGRQGGGQWHVDYIRLNAYPDGFQGFSSDIAFVQQGKRVLRDFQAMPANQFQGQEDLVDSIAILFRNLDTIFHPVLYSFQITGPGGYSWEAIAANTDVEPFNTHGFNYDTDIYEFQRNFSLPNNPDSGRFIFQHVLTSSRPDVSRSNDTMIQTVHFGNYFAYDDGTPEAGFGLSRQGDRFVSNEFAYRFPMRVPDSLVAIQIWFNDALSDMSRAFFNFAVWTAVDANGMPTQNANYIWTSEDLLPEHGDATGFFTYWLDAPLPLNSGDFFIGFQQRGQSSRFFLNIGFDINNNALNRMLIRLDGGRFINGIWNDSWDTIFSYGSVMMRPVFGTSESRPPPTNIIDRNERDDASKNIRIFPNPSDGVVFVESPENTVIRYEIFDLSGRRLSQRTTNNTQFSINLPEKSGFYILVLHTENGVVSKKVARR